MSSYHLYISVIEQKTQTTEYRTTTNDANTFFCTLPSNINTCINVLLPELENQQHARYPRNFFNKYKKI